MSLRVILKEMHPQGSHLGSEVPPSQPVIFSKVGALTSVGGRGEPHTRGAASMLFG